MFDAWSLGELTIKNRLLKAATHDCASFDEMIRSYSRLARNNIAMMTVAYVAVSEVHKTFDSQHAISMGNLDDWRRLTTAVKQASDGSARICAQLHHPGLFCMSSQGTPMGPSRGWLPSSLRWPKVLNLDDIEEIKRQYNVAARLSEQVGSFSMHHSPYSCE